MDSLLVDQEERSEGVEHSQIRDATLRDALKAVKGKVAHFENEGLRKTNFTIGVLNLCLSAFLIGKYPQHYWLFYMFKSIFLVVYKVLFIWYPLKQHYFFLDFCWIR